MKGGDADGRESPVHEKYNGKYDMVRALKEPCVLRGQTEDSWVCCKAGDSCCPEDRGHWTHAL